MADSALRLILILQKLPRHPKTISTKALHQYLAECGYAISIRTIQRDLELLSTTFPIIEPNTTDEGNRGWAINKDYRNQSFPVMEPSAALTLLMSLQHLKQLLPKEILTNIKPYIEEAKITLNAFDKNAYRSWQDKVRIIPNSPLLPSDLSENVVHIISEALLKNRKIKATYKGKKDQEINPLGFVQRGNQFYLIGTFFDFADIRITALQRYDNVEILEQTCTINANFNLDSYIQSGEMAWPWDKNKNITLQIQTNDWVANYLEEFPLSADQKIKPSKKAGWKDISASVLDTHELRWWLLSKGDSIKINKPVQLQRWLMEMIQSTTKLYETDC